MPELRRQISDPTDLGETASSRGGAGKGEAWMRIRRRLRAELGEEVFSSWFGCLELDAISDQDAYLSVPTKFLKSWISVALRGQDSSDVGQRISRDPACVDQCSFLDTASYRLRHRRPPRSRCGRRHGCRAKGPDHNVICTLPADGVFLCFNGILE